MYSTQIIVLSANIVLLMSILLYGHYLEATNPMYMIACIAFILIGYILIKSKTKLLLLTMVILIGIGSSIKIYYQLEHYQDMQTLYKGEKLLVKGYIDDIPKMTKGSHHEYYKVNLKVEEIIPINKERVGPSRKGEGNILAYIKQSDMPGGFQWGGYVEVEGTMNLFSLQHHESQIDLRGYRIDQELIGALFNTKVIDYIQPSHFLWKKYISELQEAFHMLINRHIQGPLAILLEALVFGADYSQLDETITLAFTQTGLIHILSVSGSHMTLIMTSVFWLTRRLQLRRRTSTLIGVGALGLYALLVGPSPPVIRSALVGMVGAMAVYWQRQGVALHTLSFILFCNLLWAPLSVSYVSFQFTYSATFGILLFYRGLRRYFKGWPWKTGNLIALTISAYILVLPFQWHYFHEFSLIMFLANIWMSPFLEFFIVGTFITVLSEALVFYCFELLRWGGFFGEILLYIDKFCLTVYDAMYSLWEYLLAYILGFIYFLSDFPMSTIPVLPMNSVELLMYSMFIVALFFYLRWQISRPVCVAIMLFSLCMSLIHLYWIEQRSTLHIYNEQDFTAYLYEPLQARPLLFIIQKNDYKSAYQMVQIRSFYRHYTKTHPQIKFYPENKEY